MGFVLVRRLLTEASSSFRNHTDYFLCLPICFPVTPTPSSTNTNKTEQNSRGIDLLIIDYFIRTLGNITNKCQVSLAGPLRIRKYLHTLTSAWVPKILCLNGNDFLLPPSLR